MGDCAAPTRSLIFVRYYLSCYPTGWGRVATGAGRGPAGVIRGLPRDSGTPISSCPVSMARHLGEKICPCQVLPGIAKSG